MVTGVIWNNLVSVVKIAKIPTIATAVNNITSSISLIPIAKMY
jgi:hypothetical protein